MWNGLPVIRKEIAKSMIKDYDLSQKEAAEKLGVTPAAVCQYLSRKRGKIKIVDEIILIEIKVSAERIIKKEQGRIVTETCRICKLLRTRGVFSCGCETCDADE
jgi:hypothetical protein